MTPTSRTLAHYRAQGWTVEVVERFIQGANVRRDLFGFADLLGFYGDTVAAIQCSTTGSIEAHIRKARELDTYAKWLESPHREVHFCGWAFYKKTLDRKHWRPTIKVAVNPEDYA